MKILMFSAYYTPEIAASMYLVEDILEGMTQKGYYVDLYVPSPCRGIDKQTRLKYKNKKKEILYDGHLVVHRFKLYKERKNIIFRAIRYVLLIVLFFWYGLWKKTDLIFVQSTPPIQGVMAGTLAKIKKVPLVYNLQDIFPDSLVNTGIAKKDGFAWRLGRTIENYTYKSADKIIVISDDFKTNIMKKGVSERKIVVSKNWADIDKVNAIEKEKNELFKRYNLDINKFFIVYSGNIGYTQNMDLLLNVAKKIANKIEDIEFVLIGEGIAKNNVMERITNEKIVNVTLLPFQPYEEISRVFSLGDVGLIISKPGVGNNSLPSKTWGIMAAERPILASFDLKSELANIIEKTKCGVIVEAGNEEKLVEAIERLYQNKSLLKIMGIEGKKYVSRNLSKENGVEKYMHTLEEYDYD